MRPPSRRLTVGLALATLYVVWGSTYLGIKLALPAFPTFFMTGLRYSLAGALVIAVIALRGNFRASATQCLGAVISGSFLIVIGNGAVVWSEQYVGTGIVAIVNSTLPFWIVILSWILLRDRLSLLTGIGLAVGFGGLVVLVGPITVHPHELMGVLAVLAAAFGWGLGTVLTRKLPVPDSAFLVSGLQMMGGGLVALLVSVLNGDLARFRPAALTLSAAGAFVYLVLVGAILGYGIFQWLVKNASLPLVSTYAYVSPVVAVILGILVLGEMLTAHALVGGAIVVGGVVIIVTAQARRRRQSEARSGTPPAGRGAASGVRS